MVDRPTFHESWYRVATLKPRLVGSVQITRQQFRGETWYVVADPVGNQHFRLSEPAYQFVGMLDGRRTVADAWAACNDRLGDAAPTQGEAIQTLGQLYSSNLLRGDMPADAAGMFERYRKRTGREIRGYLTNFLFIRIPLFDPNRMLDRWVGVFGWMFGYVGFALWSLLIIAAGWQLAGKGGQLVAAGQKLLAREQLMQIDTLLLIYLAFAITKAIHELGHGFCCKRFGRLNGTGGDVHTIGIMMLVFMPIPYVDASSAWLFRSKWHRAFVAAAGMYVEAAVAAIAAIIWANTGPGIANDLAYKTMFIAGVTTLLFNGNPLLRYDGYYILSDLIEAPNLAQRSKQHLYYLVRKYAYGVQRVVPVAHTTGEKLWLFIYGIASFVYRVIICAGILLFIAGQFFLVGIAMAIAAVATWVVVPLIKYAHYLLTSPELHRTRQRALGITAAVLVALIVGVGVIERPEHVRAEGWVEPVHMTAIYMGEDGFVDRMIESGTIVDADSPLVFAHNADLHQQRDVLRAERLRYQAELRSLINEDNARAGAIQRTLAVIERQIERLDERIASLTVMTDQPGIWVGHDAQRKRGAFIARGQPLGLIVDDRQLIVRAAADQRTGPRLAALLSADAVVEMRVRRRPDIEVAGRITSIATSGSKVLPSPALSMAAGGAAAIDPNAERQGTAAEPHFEVRIDPQATDAGHMPLRPGQRVIVRFELPARPLAAQWWHAIRQMLQQRLQI